MWAAIPFVVYLALALAIPVVWTLRPVWRKARVSRLVECPESEELARVTLDACYAVKMRALGDTGRRIGVCSRWPEQQGCGQECLRKIDAAA